MNAIDTPHEAVNLVHTKSGKVRAVCEFCGRTSAPHVPMERGGVSVWDLPRGWSVAPYPNAYAHPDGSTGDLYQCRRCNERADAGDLPMMPRHEPKVTR